MSCPGRRLRENLRNGLVGYWPCWEGDGDKAMDYSGCGHHGTLTNFSDPSAAWGYDSELGRGTVTFAAGTQHIVIPQSAIAQATFSLCWWEWAAASNEGYFACDSTDVTNLYLRRYDNGAKIAGGIGDVTFATPVVSNQAWHQHVVTHDAAGNANWYIDGAWSQLKAGSNFSGLNSDLFVGNNAAFDRDFVGPLSDPLIYNRALSPGEIHQLYANPYEDEGRLL